MPLTSFADLSLAHIFEDLPFLVASHGLFVDVHGYGNLANDGDLGCITLKVVTYSKKGELLKESRLLRKMQQLPPCVLPCTYCAEPGSAIVEADRCPLCLTVCAIPSWTKTTSIAKVTVSTTGRITIDSPHADILTAFLAPLFLARTTHYEEHRENIIRVSEEAERKKAELRKRRQHWQDARADADPV